MTTTQILDEIKHLRPAERLLVIERAIRMLRADWPESAEAGRRQMEEAAAEALPYYQAGGELTAFTALDGEDFYDYETK